MGEGKDRIAQLERDLAAQTRLTESLQRTIESLQAALTQQTKAFEAVVDSLEMKDGLLSMPLISAPTIAIQLIPYLGYKYTPRGNDWTYGLAALFFAALNYRKLLQAGKLP